MMGVSRDWLVHGPDLSGRYGGLQGTGGIEAVVNDSSKVAAGIVCDLYGHVEATVTGGTVVNCPWQGADVGNPTCATFERRYCRTPRDCPSEL